MPGAASPPIHTVTQDEAPPLTEEQIALLAQANAGVLPGMAGDVEIELTDAELEVLKARGGTVSVADAKHGFDELNPFASKDRELIFRLGEGDSKLEGRLTHTITDRENVMLWHRDDGRPRALRRAHLMFYLAKGCWVPRPPFEAEKPKFKCPSAWSNYKNSPRHKNCGRDRFTNEQDALDHFERFHNREFKAAEQTRLRLRDASLDQLLEAVVSRPASAPQQDDLVAQVAALVRVLQDATTPEQAAETYEKQKANNRKMVTPVDPAEAAAQTPPAS